MSHDRIDSLCHSCLFFFVQRYGTVRGEDVPFCLGLPLTPLFPYNYSQQDIQTSRILIHYLANFIQTGYVSLSRAISCFSNREKLSFKLRNPNGDATPTSKHSIDVESLKHLGSSFKSHYGESLPAPSLLSSSASIPTSSLKHQTQQQKSSDENVSSSSSSMNNQNTNNDVVMKESEKDGRIVVVEESLQQQQSQFIHHALSSTNNRHRRSLTATGSSNGNSNRRLISKRYIVKRNFPNNQLSKASNEMDVDDSNETELDGTDDGENDDYIEGEKEREKQQLHSKNGHDRLDNDDNESDSEQSMKLTVPFWDAYDTVNQLFLEMSKYTLHDQSFLIINLPSSSLLPFICFI
jgi:hypothetical protein